LLDVARRLLGSEYVPVPDHLMAAFQQQEQEEEDEGTEEADKVVRAEAFLRRTDDFRRRYAVILDKVVGSTRAKMALEEAYLPVDSASWWAEHKEGAYLDRLRDVWSYDVDDLKRDVDIDLKRRLHEDNEHVLRDFHDVFGRPMFVQEFLRYRELSRGNFPPETDRQEGKAGGATSVEDWKREFQLDRPYSTLLCNVIRKVYHVFMGVEVSEYDVVARYLPLLAKAGRCAEAIENYYDAVTEEAIAHDGYVTAMSAKVADMYKERYGAGLVRGPDDAAYLVKKVRHLRMSLVDERLTDVVRDFQRETDILNDAVTCTFEAVVERPPEQDELNTYQDVFRREDADGGRAFVVETEEDGDGRLEGLKAFVERDIVSGLEFHEVIKERLTSSVAEQPLSRVALFGRLRRVIADIQSMPFEDRTYRSALHIISSVSTASPPS